MPDEIEVVETETAEVDRELENQLHFEKGIVDPNQFLVWLSGEQVGLEEEIVYLRDLHFHSSNGTNTVEYKVPASSEIRLYGITNLALKNLCGLTRVPYNFFVTLSAEDRERIMEPRLREVERRKRLMKLKINENGEGVIRGFLSPQHRTLSNHEIFNIAWEQVMNNQPIVNYIEGGGTFDKSLYLQFYYGEDLQVDSTSKMYKAIDLVSSELGQSMCINPSFYRKTCRNAFILTYSSGDAYFKSNYRDTTPEIVSTVFSGFDDLIGERISSFKTCINETKETPLSIEELQFFYTDISNMKGVSKRFMTECLQKAASGEVRVNNKFDAINLMTSEAQRLKSYQQKSVESLTTSLMGLSLN